MHVNHWTPPRCFHWTIRKRKCMWIKILFCLWGAGIYLSKVY
jgi:hypothetical protein